METIEKLGRWKGIVDQTWVPAKGLGRALTGSECMQLGDYWKGGEGKETVKDGANALTWTTELVLTLSTEVENKGGRAGLNMTTNSVCCRLYFSKDCHASIYSWCSV